MTPEYGYLSTLVIVLAIVLSLFLAGCIYVWWKDTRPDGGGEPPKEWPQPPKGPITVWIHDDTIVIRDTTSETRTNFYVDIRDLTDDGIEKAIESWLKP